MKISGYIKGGNSFPVILESKEKKFLLKLRAGMSSKYSLINEWIGNSLGKKLNINTQVPHWFTLEDGIEIGDIHLEVKELIHKSKGLNIGFIYHASANVLDADELKNLPQKTRNHIFLFDLMMINVDRTPDNINVMKVGNDVYSIDYESSLLFQDIIENKNLLTDNRVLQNFRNNPLYEELDESTIDEFLQKINEVSFEETLSGIPLRLLNEVNRNRFLEAIAKRRIDAWSLKEIMSKLKELKVESYDQLKTRRNKNQEEFKRKFKENLI